MFKKNIVKVVILIAVFLCIGFFIYNSMNPDVIKYGDNRYIINSNISNGLDIIKQIINKSVNKPDNYNISYFKFEVNKDGKIKNFDVTLNVFDNDTYNGYMSYHFSNNKLTYNKLQEDNLPIVTTYSKNSELEYLNNSIKKIPLIDQIKVSELKYYVIEYDKDTRIEKDTPIFDGRNNQEFKVLSKTDYNNKLGGVSDGNTSVVIRLYDGSSIAMGQQYLYVFDPIENVVVNPGNMMPYDYYINNNTIKFTRDYGVSYIDLELTDKQLNETYRVSGYTSELSPNSWFLGDTSLPIALFYGEKPVLKLSNDNGNTWKDIEFNIPDDEYITRRVIGFNDKIGFAALGTDWTMGNGEDKQAFISNDSGDTWSKVTLPENNTSKTLKDFYMYDDKIGIVVLENKESDLPIIYATKDGANTWSQITLPEMSDVTYLSDVDSIEYIDNQYVVTLGQGNSGTLKAILKTNDITGSWSFEKIDNKDIHKNG